jgi:hypothetical protein
MRRSRLASLVGAVLLAALLLPQAALATGTSATATAARTTTTTTAATTLPRFRLGCALVVRNPLAATPGRAIVCRWAASEGVSVRAYGLWRIVDAPGGSRQLLATVAADQPLRFADHDVKRGHAYTYRVVALGADGSRVALSNRVTVRVGRPADKLRFDCAFVLNGDRSGVACRWSGSTRPAAVRYVVWRSVDGGPREAVYRTGIGGRRTFLDRDVTAGQVIRYAVVAYARHGRVVGVGGPDLVTIPDWSAVAR